MNEKVARRTGRPQLSHVAVNIRVGAATDFDLKVCVDSGDRLLRELGEGSEQVSARASKFVYACSV